MSHIDFVLTSHSYLKKLYLHITPPLTVENIVFLLEYFLVVVVVVVVHLTQLETMQTLCLLFYKSTAKSGSARISFIINATL